MAARPMWRGQIRLALVSIPVEIYSATKSGATIAFHQIHEPSGKRVKYEKVVPGIGPVHDAAELEKVLVATVKTVRAGGIVVIDVIVQTGYSPSMTAGLTRSDD